MYCTSGSTIIVAAALATACATGAAHALDPLPAPDVAVTPGATGRLKTTGRGRMPRRAGSEAQLRLMAKRAAVVEAYKNVARDLGQARSIVAGGTGSETVCGFIRGVELIETRYYRDGDVEVDVEFTVPAPLPPADSMDVAPGCAEGLLLVEKGGGPMREEEWRAILGGGIP